MSGMERLEGIAKAYLSGDSQTIARLGDDLRKDILSADESDRRFQNVEDDACGDPSFARLQ